MVATTSRAAQPSALVSRRQQILDTAAVVLAEKGIVGATVRDISERAGILSGSLYHHFASKEEMISEILLPVIRAQIGEFDRIVEQTNDPVEILRLVIVAEVNQSARTPSVARILRQDEHHISAHGGLDEVVRHRRALRSRVESVIDRGIISGAFRSDCDPRVSSLTFFDLTLGAYRHLKPFGRYRAEPLGAHLSALFLRSVLSTANTANTANTAGSAPISQTAQRNISGSKPRQTGV